MDSRRAGLELFYKADALERALCLSFTSVDRLETLEVYAASCHRSTTRRIARRHTMRSCCLDDRRTCARARSVFLYLTTITILLESELPLEKDRWTACLRRLERRTVRMTQCTEAACALAERHALRSARRYEDHGAHVLA